MWGTESPLEVTWAQFQLPLDGLKGTRMHISLSSIFGIHGSSENGFSMDIEAPTVNVDKP